MCLGGDDLPGVRSGRGPLSGWRGGHDGIGRGPFRKRRPRRRNDQQVIHTVEAVALEVRLNNLIFRRDRDDVANWFEFFEGCIRGLRRSVGGPFLEE